MSRYTCTDCHEPIPNGEAVIRSISFERVAFCSWCAERRGIAPVERSLSSCAPA